VVSRRRNFWSTYKKIDLLLIHDYLSLIVIILITENFRILDYLSPSMDPSKQQENFNAD